VARGRRLFDTDRAGCAFCHSGAMGTDRLKHDVHSRARADEGGTFDTPSLRFVARTAPYFHDGRFATLEELLRGSDGTMGRTRQLSDAEFADLAAYLKSL